MNGMVTKKHIQLNVRNTVHVQSLQIRLCCVSTHPDDDDDDDDDENGDNDDGDDSDEGDDDSDNDDNDADEETLTGKSHPCYQCNSSFAEASELTMHLVAHSVMYNTRRKTSCTDTCDHTTMRNRTHAGSVIKHQIPYQHS